MDPKLLLLEDNHIHLIRHHVVFVQFELDFRMDSNFIIQKQYVKVNQSSFLNFSVPLPSQLPKTIRNSHLNSISNKNRDYK